MTDKVRKIREEVVGLQKRAEHNFDISLTENERQFWLGESSVLTLIGMYIDLQEEPTSEDLIDVAKQYVKEHVIGIDKVTFSIATDMFISGAKWQKEQVEKDAIIATIESDLDPHGADYGNQKIICGWGELEAKKFKNGSKVKLIIIKED